MGRANVMDKRPQDIAELLRIIGQSNTPNDTILAHITPEEAQLLKARGGSGKLDPNTGLPHFDTGDNDDASGDSYGDGPGTGTGDNENSSTSDSGESASSGFGGGWSDAGWAESLGGIGAAIGGFGGFGDMGLSDAMSAAAESLGSEIGNIGGGDLGFSTNPLDYMNEISPDVAAPGALVQEAISNYAANPESWNEAFGDAMVGQPSGFMSDLADWASREGIVSQVGAGQVGFLDDVDLSSVAGLVAGLTMGPWAGIAAKAGTSFLSDLTKGRDPTIGLGTNLGKSTAGVIGSVVANTVAPGWGALGSQLGKSGFSWAESNLGPAPAADPGTSLGQTSNAQTNTSFGQNNTWGNSKDIQNFLYGAGGALAGNYLASYGGNLNNLINNAYGNKSMATNPTQSGNLFGDIANLFPYIYGATDNRRQEDAENQLSGLSKYQDLLGQSYTNPQAIYDQYYKPIDTMFNQQQMAQDAAQGRGTDAYKRDVAREANFYNYLSGMQGRLADLGYGTAQQNYFGKTQNAANQQSGNAGALYSQLFGGQQGGQSGSSPISSAVGGITSGDYYRQLQNLIGADSSTGFWDDLSSLWSEPETDYDWLDSIGGSYDVVGDY